MRMQSEISKSPVLSLFVDLSCRCFETVMIMTCGFNEFIQEFGWRRRRRRQRVGPSSGVVGAAVSCAVYPLISSLFSLSLSLLKQNPKEI